MSRGETKAIPTTEELYGGDTHTFLIAARRAAKSYGRVWQFLSEAQRTSILRNFVRQVLAEKGA